MLFSKKHKISIINPCIENWNNMTVADKGRFCDACSKKVIDFTEMTEKEIITYLKNKKGDTCGRFESKQVEKIYSIDAQLKIPVSKRFMRYALSLFVSTEFISEKAISQTDTVQSIPLDTTNKLVRIDSMINDKAADAVVERDTTCIENDTAPVIVSTDWEKLLLEHRSDLDTNFSKMITITMGTFTFPRVEGPTFMEACRKILADTLFKDKRPKPTTSVEQDDHPLPDKPPVKANYIETALLPNEIKVIGKKRPGK
jgi:hypothetical protein